MSFLAGGSGGADCGPVNPMAGLMKQFQQDRSLQQDRFGPEQRGESSKPTFRTRPMMNGPDRQMTDEFFHEEMASRPMNNAFEMNGLNHELERIQMPPPQQQVVHHQRQQMPTPDWANDFMQVNQPQQQQQQFDDFEGVYQKSQPHQQPQPMHQMQMRHFPMIQGRNWNAEYSAFQQSNPGYTQNEKDMFEQAFEQAKQNTQQVNWEQEFAAQESWATEFQEEQKEEQAKETFVDNGDLARTAAMLLDSVDAEANPKFKNSQFMDLMRKLRDSEVTIEGDKMVETKGKSWASEFEGSAQTKDWTSEFVQNAGNATSGNMWSNEFAQKAERGWTEDWSADFNNQASTSEAQMHELFGKGSEMDDWVQQYNKNIAHLKTAQDREWDDMQKDWERFKPEQGLGYRATNPNYDTYNFTVNNPYLMNPEAIEGTSHNTLSDAILALEAKAQLQTNDATAWQQLGMRQQENERDDAAISALRQAVKMNPSSLESWLALAVSYTNENCRADAYDALEEWIAHNDQYNQLLNVTKGKMTVSDRHAYITDLFIQAARNSPGAEMDADVQVGLGVLFNMSEEYEKAIDCFKSALGSRPQDYLLWNKLGATLANSRDAPSAINAYFNALEINPAYVRARYNVAISCINLGQQQEAAEHLLTALALQQQNNSGASTIIDDQGNTVNVPGGMSDNIWGTLRVLMLNMNRPDLAKNCDQHNINGFRSEFDF